MGVGGGRREGEKGTGLMRRTETLLFVERSKDTSAIPRYEQRCGEGLASGSTRPDNVGDGAVGSPESGYIGGREPIPIDVVMPRWRFPQRHDEFGGAGHGSRPVRRERRAGGLAHHTVQHEGVLEQIADKLEQLVPPVPATTPNHRRLKSSSADNCRGGYTSGNESPPSGKTDLQWYTSGNTVVYLSAHVSPTPSTYAHASAQKR